MINIKNKIVIEPLNQELQEEKQPIAFLLHHSNTIFIDLLKSHLKKELIEVQKEININKDNLNYQSAMEKLEEYLKSYVPKPGDIFGVEANLGNPASTVSSCFLAIDQVLQKNPKAIIFIFTNTKECIEETLKKYQGQQVYYIGAQTFDITDQIVAGRTFINAGKFHEFYNNMQVPVSPTASVTSGPVLSNEACSPKLQPENSIFVSSNKIIQFFKKISSCCSFRFTRNNDSSINNIEKKFIEVVPYNVSATWRSHSSKSLLK